LLRRSRRPFGLRSRLLLALVATSLATLLAAALALFSPLQDRLREQQASGLTAAGRTARPGIEAAIRRDLRDVGVVGLETSTALRGLAARASAQVAVTDVAGVPLEGSVPPGDDLLDVREVLATNATTITRQDDRQRIALPLNTKPPFFGTLENPRFPFYVLVLRQSDAQVSRTVDEVRQAFATAAVVGLGSAIILGLFLTTTLTRRLARLRDAAVRITTEGMDAPTPLDESSDEVGDLARAMGRMQEGLRRQEDARRQFVATASHELRTPLTSLSGNLELLGEDLAAVDFDREDAVRQVTAAQGEIRRLRNLATELLDLSRLDAGVALRSEPVELGEVARAVAAEFALQAHERRTLLEVVPPRGPCWAQGDPDAVARVARILIDNALRYTPPSTAVRVLTGYAGEGATLAVVDDGPGVPMEEHEAIFERFRRGAATRGEGGFGLGLAIGRELAQRLGGGLELEPATPHGARFVLTLPIELPAGGVEH
jgi:signal transduction histidine kinase